MTALYIIYLLGTPLLLMNLARRWRWIDRVSPMTLLYIIGIAVANSIGTSATTSSINDMVGNIAIPLAIPLMLLGCDIRRISWRNASRVLISGLVAVLVVSVGGYFLFRHGPHDTEFAKVCAVATGMYTGGIPNVGAIAKGVGLEGENYLYLTSYDLIATGLYLIFIVFAGKIVFRRLLPYGRAGATSTRPQPDLNPTLFPFDREHRKGSFLAIGTAVAIAAVSLVLAKLAGGDDGVNMTVLILALTTLAIAASLTKPMRKQQGSFDIGLYLVYLFCFTIANSCDIRQMSLSGSLNIFGYVMFVIFVSIVLQIIMARLLKIDGDTVMVSSVALINSPPFVPMAAALLGNKDVIVTGISIGLIGYMLGNYLGIAVFNLLLLF